MKLSTATLTLVAAALCASAEAAYVIPTIGGGQVGMMGAPMIHTDVSFDGTNISLMADTSHGVPVLRPLTPPDEFDPAQPWIVLQNKAYNFQHAWNPGGFITLPAGTGIWVERISQTPGLEVYQRPPAAPSYLQIFQADGERWKWSGAMTHNAYAVLNPTLSTFSATYRVYIGDATTGTPLGGYGSAEVTWNWSVVPEPTSLALVAGATLIARRRRSV